MLWVAFSYEYDSASNLSHKQNNLSLTKKGLKLFCFWCPCLSICTVCTGVDCYKAEMSLCLYICLLLLSSSQSFSILNFFISSSVLSSFSFLTIIFPFTFISILFSIFTSKRKSHYILDYIVGSTKLNQYFM
jgi:hypothetical protein